SRPPQDQPSPWAARPWRRRGGGPECGRASEGRTGALWLKCPKRLKIVKLGLLCNAFPEWHLHARSAEPHARGGAPRRRGVARPARRAAVPCQTDSASPVAAPSRVVGYRSRVASEYWGQYESLDN